MSILLSLLALALVACGDGFSTGVDASPGPGPDVLEDAPQDGAARTFDAQDEKTSPAAADVDAGDASEGSRSELDAAADVAGDAMQACCHYSGETLCTPDKCIDCDGVMVCVP